MVGDKQPLTPSSRDTKAFHEEPGCLLARSRQNMCRRLVQTPSILRKLPESENLVQSATAMDENGTVVAMISKSDEQQKQKSKFGLRLVIKVLSI